MRISTASSSRMRAMDWIAFIALILLLLAVLILIEGLKAFRHPRAARE